MNRTAHPGRVDDDLLLRALRAELCAFLDLLGPRKVSAPVFHLGTPGGRRGSEQLAIAAAPGHDAGLRADLVEQAAGLLPRLDPAPVAWMTRTGALAPTDLDLAWLAAARAGLERHGRSLGSFFVITRSGWRELLTGAEHAERIRRRPRRAR